MTGLLTASWPGRWAELVETDSGSWVWRDETGAPLKVASLPRQHRELLGDDAGAASVCCSDLGHFLKVEGAVFGGPLVGELLARQALVEQGDRPCASA
jgi:hypothetical protein